jgi:DNA invertase Pin-like site-specific DNA recombinase
MLTVLAGLAEFERDLIRTRTGEGRARAYAQGIRMGRKPKLTIHQQKEALIRREADEALILIALSYKCQSQHDFSAQSASFEVGSGAVTCALAVDVPN